MTLQCIHYLSTWLSGSACIEYDDTFSEEFTL